MESRQINSFSLVELKGLAYDCLSIIENNQRTLNALNARIVELSKQNEVLAETVKAEKVEEK